MLIIVIQASHKILELVMALPQIEKIFQEFFESKINSIEEYSKKLPLGLLKSLAKKSNTDLRKKHVFIKVKRKIMKLNHIN